VLLASLLGSLVGIYTIALGRLELMLGLEPSPQNVIEADFISDSAPTGKQSPDGVDGAADGDAAGVGGADDANEAILFAFVHNPLYRAASERVGPSSDGDGMAKLQFLTRMIEEEDRVQCVEIQRHEATLKQIAAESQMKKDRIRQQDEIIQHLLRLLAADESSAALTASPSCGDQTESALPRSSLSLASSLIGRIQDEESAHIALAESPSSLSAHSPEDRTAASPRGVDASLMQDSTTIPPDQHLAARADSADTESTMLRLGRSNFNDQVQSFKKDEPKPKSMNVLPPPPVGVAQIVSRRRPPPPPPRPQ
jgi:hypothetical protein